MYIKFSFGISYFPKTYVATVKDGLQASQIALIDARQKHHVKHSGVYQLDMQSFNFSKPLPLDLIDTSYPYF